MPIQTNDASPLCALPDTKILLQPTFYGSVERYASIAVAGASYVATDRRYDKRLKESHRMEIADVNGRLRLTLPVAKPESIMRARWSDVRLSSHGDWSHFHLTALESAYGRTPYFEFYIDRFKPFMASTTVDEYETLMKLDEAIERTVCDILGIASPVYGAEMEYESDERSECQLSFSVGPYEQIRFNELGFLPGLSILDLIFNMGPESPLVIREALRGNSSIEPFFRKK